MLKDCLKVFENVLEKSEGDKLIIDSYIPADGTYIIVSPKDEVYEIKDPVNIKLDKKTKEIDRSNKYYEELCNYDYNSKLVDMNKPIDSKKIIHSNNYLSFFIKKESLTNGKLTNEIIDNYYEVLSNPNIKYSKSKNAMKIYETVEEEIGKVDIEKLEKIKNWIKDNIFNLNTEVTGKDYLKIFFEAPIEEYKREGKRYLIPNIYNNNDFNINSGNEIYGLPNDNMGLNAKKPYLENKTRKVTVPYLLSNNEVLLQKKFFDYLMNFAAMGKVNVYIDNSNNEINPYESGDLPDNNFNGIFLRIKKGKEVEILDYDIITGYKYKLPKEFLFENILKLDLTNKNISIEHYGIYRTMEKMQKIINEVFFSGILVNNYFTEPDKISTKKEYLKRNILLARQALFNYTHKGMRNEVFPIINKISLNLIKSSIEDGYRTSAGHEFNLRWSLIHYFKEGKGMAEILKAINEALREKINSNEYNPIENDEQYYFAVGQFTSFLLTKYRGKNNPPSLAKPIINAKNNVILKEHLRKMYDKYSYDPQINTKRFKNLFVMIIGYVPESKVNQDMVIGGFLSNSLIYESNKGVVINE